MTPALFAAGMVGLCAALCVGAVRAWRVLDARPLRPLEAWVGRLAVAAVMALPLLADAGALPGPRGGGGGAALQTTGGTMTGAIVCNDGLGGPATCMTTGTGNDLVLAPAGTRQVKVVSADTSVTNVDWKDRSFNLLDDATTAGIRMRPAVGGIEMLTSSYAGYAPGYVAGSTMEIDAISGVLTLYGTSGITATHTLTLSAGLTLSTVNATFTGTQDNYATCTGFVQCRLDGSSTPIINGMTGGSGAVRRTLCNVGAADIVIAHEAAGSTAANRFDLSGSTNYTLVQKTCVDFTYDNTSARWRKG